MKNGMLIKDLSINKSFILYEKKLLIIKNLDMISPKLFKAPNKPENTDNGKSIPIIRP